MRQGVVNCEFQLTICTKLHFQCSMSSSILWRKVELQGPTPEHCHSDHIASVIEQCIGHNSNNNITMGMA